jgi:sec-independent protein translocase protein TatA
MGDMAQGIKAFKKGMSDDDAAKADPKPGEPMKTINADLKQQAETTKKFEGGTV